jgi:hypothetical protein
MGASGLILVLVLFGLILLSLLRGGGRVDWHLW